MENSINNTELNNFDLLSPKAKEIVKSFIDDNGRDFSSLADWMCDGAALEEISQELSEEIYDFAITTEGAE